MVYEKSCGFVVYREIHGIREYLVICASNGEYGFPKGHVECNETEYETAIRELKEETNLEVQIIEGFRKQIEYNFPNKVNVVKRSVYFLGKCLESNIVCQETEVSEAIFVSIEKALELLSFEETKRILKDADAYICLNTDIQQFQFKEVSIMDAKLLGKCGFYCGACPTYLNENCKGCIGEHTKGDCFSRDCVIEKGLSFCGECNNFPCNDIINKPHSTVIDKEWLLWKRNSNTNR